MNNSSYSKAHFSTFALGGESELPCQREEDVYVPWLMERTFMSSVDTMDQVF